VGRFVELEQGTRQSPIAIFSRSAHPTRGHAIVLDYGKATERVVNKGHTVEVDYSAGSSITFDGRTYAFRQFHFHTPSEHVVDGERFPLEMHMVHQCPGDASAYLVLAVLFREGPPDKFLDEFVRAIPATPGQEVTSTEIDICEVFSPRDHYFVYPGSLTTPPYTERVSWLVRASPRSASREQITRFRGIEGENARHIQPTKGRPVEYQ
jgi:carbonic anhydrase